MCEFSPKGLLKNVENFPGLRLGHVVAELRFSSIQYWQLCITFKVTTLCYKAYWVNKPSYLHATLKPYMSCHGLRSAEMDSLTVPSSHTKTAVRRFCSAASTVWNELPLVICNSDSIGTFQLHLKMHLFHLNFLAELLDVLFRASDSIFNMFIY